MNESKIICTILLTMSFAGLLFCTILFRFQIKKIRRKLNESRKNENHLKEYLKMFSQRDQNDIETKNWMNLTAKYVADFIKADGVSIYLAEVNLKNKDGSIVDMDKIHIPEQAKYSLAGMNSSFPLELNKELCRDSGISDQAMEQSNKDEPLQNFLFASILKNDNLLLNNPNDSSHGRLLKNFRLTSLLGISLKNPGEDTVGIIIAVTKEGSMKQPISQENASYLSNLIPSIVMLNNLLNTYRLLPAQWKFLQELEFTKNMQLSLLPPKNHTWGTFSINADSKPAKRVGGDFYDFIEIDNNRALVVIGDASGNGLQACMYMTRARSYIHANLSHFTTLKELLYEVNSNLYREIHDEDNDHYITLAMCLLHKRDNTIEYICAGHTNLVIYVRNHTRVVHPQGGVIGLYPDEILDFDPFIIQFDEDMAFLMYTDGINEAESSTGEQFGDARIEASFIESVRKAENCGMKIHKQLILPSEVIDKLMNEVETFTASTDPNKRDDRTLVMISHKKQESKGNI